MQLSRLRETVEQALKRECQVNTLLSSVREQMNEKIRETQELKKQLAVELQLVLDYVCSWGVSEEVKSKVFPHLPLMMIGERRGRDTRKSWRGSPSENGRASAGTRNNFEGVCRLARYGNWGTGIGVEI